MASLPNWARLVLAAALLAAALQVHAWWVSPERRIGRFLAAARRADAAAMLSLASREEVERLGLTPAKWAAVLADASGVPGGPLPAHPEPEFYGVPQINYNRGVGVRLLARNGAPLKGGSGGPAGALVVAYRTDAGWRIALTRYLQSMLASRAGMNARPGFYRALCARHGLPPEIYKPENETWVSPPQPR